MDPAKVIKFNTFIDTVVDKDPLTNTDQTYTNQSVCGDLSYELVNITGGTEVALDVDLIGSIAVDTLDTDYRNIMIETIEKKFDMTTHYL